jgi:hypothetical protein
MAALPKKAGTIAGTADVAANFAKFIFYCRRFGEEAFKELDTYG